MQKIKEGNHAFLKQDSQFFIIHTGFCTKYAVILIRIASEFARDRILFSALSPDRNKKDLSREVLYYHKERSLSADS